MFYFRGVAPKYFAFWMKINCYLIKAVDNFTCVWLNYDNVRKLFLKKSLACHGLGKLLCSFLTV